MGGSASITADWKELHRIRALHASFTCSGPTSSAPARAGSTSRHAARSSSRKPRQIKIVITIPETDLATRRRHLVWTPRSIFVFKRAQFLGMVADIVEDKLTFLPATPLRIASIGYLGK